MIRTDRVFQIGCICGLLMAISACGCLATKSATGAANIAAARDFTYHGLNALHHGRAEQAEQLLNQAVQASPDDQRLRHHLADALVEQGKVDQAIAQLNAAVSKSEDPRLLVELGQLYLLKQKPVLARQCADQVLAINRQSPGGWILKGRCEMLTGDNQAALASFHRAAGMNQSIEPCDPQVHVYLAETYRMLNRPIQALNALEVFSDNFAADQLPVQAMLLYSETLVDLNQHERAIEYLAAAAKRPNADRALWLALSQIQSRSGNRSAAIMTAENGLRSFPNDVELKSWSQSLQNQPDDTGQRTAGLPAGLSIGNIR